jgi:hypothetical protein
MSRTLIETPEAFHGQQSVAPDLRGLAARHVEPERVVDWQRKATDLSELLGAALDEIDRLKARLAETSNLLGGALAAIDKPRMSRDCRTCRYNSDDGLNACRVPVFSLDVLDWVRMVDTAGLLDRDCAVIADTPTDCPGWASK